MLFVRYSTVALKCTPLNLSPLILKTLNPRSVTYDCCTVIQDISVLFCCRHREDPSFVGCVLYPVAVTVALNPGLATDLFDLNFKIIVFAFDVSLKSEGILDPQR